MKKKTCIYPTGLQEIAPLWSGFEKAWSVICRREMPKNHKIYMNVHATLVQNAKKASLMVQKEVRKKAQKNMKTAREVGARAKKLTKEVCILLLLKMSSPN